MTVLALQLDIQLIGDLNLRGVYRTPREGAARGRSA